MLGVAEFYMRIPFSFLVFNIVNKRWSSQLSQHVQTNMRILYDMTESC